VTAPVEAAADRIWAALPNLSAAALHNLLYLSQGYCIGGLHRPLFLNDILAGPGGAEIGPARRETGMVVAGSLTTSECLVVDRVIDRFGSMSEVALAEVVRGTEPWQEADHGGWVIAPEVMRDEFARTLHAEGGG
jgi:uncharacterized phage-associated protein